MPTPVYPGVYVEEVPHLPPPIARVDLATTFIAGLAVRGPVDRAPSITSFADATRWFGSPTADATLVRSLSHYFANGGRLAQVVRLAAPDAKAAHAENDDVAITAIGPGVSGNRLRAHVTPDPAAPSRFRLELFDDATRVERFDGLTIDPGDTFQAPTVVAKDSTWIRLAAKRDGPPAEAKLELAGGSDGTPMVVGDAAFGAALDAGFAKDGPMEAVDFALACVPGLVDAESLKRLRGLCRTRQALLIADADPGAATGPGALDDSAADVALYAPWLRAQGAIVPPSPLVAGLHARTDAARGPWKASAGLDATLIGVDDLASPVDDRRIGTLKDAGINALRRQPDGRIVVFGARTLAGVNPVPFRYVPVRRLQLLLGRSLSAGLAWTVFETNDDALWGRVRAAVENFLLALWRDGALAGTKPAQAYYVRCGRDTMTATDIAAGRLIVEIGYAPVKPSEFVVFRIGLNTAEAA